MPNGQTSPVTGLDVIHVNRTAEFNTRFEWRQAHDVFWAVAVHGAYGWPATSDIQVGSDTPSFEHICARTRRMFTEEGRDYPRDWASVVRLNVSEGRGTACGEFIVYGEVSGRWEVLHDQSLRSTASDEELEDWSDRPRDLLLANWTADD